MATPQIEKLQRISKLCRAAHDAYMNGEELTPEQEAILYLEEDGSNARKASREDRSTRLAAQGKLLVLQRMVDAADEKNATVIGVTRIKDVLGRGIEEY